jgi:hypothetical protein
MKTLVACPIARHKLYSLELWAQATAAYDRLMVIDEAESDIAESIRQHGIEVLTYRSPEEDPRDLELFHHPFTPKKYNEAYRTIFDYADEQGFDYVLSLQSDNIPSDDVLEILEENWDEGVDFLIQLNPWRDSYGRPGNKGYEMGCTLARTATWKRALEELPEPGVPLYWGVYQTEVRNPNYHFTNKMIDAVQIKHLDG